MSGATYWKPGDWNAVCYRCGFKFKASELRKTWKGFYACHKDWEPRHPQDFVRSIPDKPGVPWAQDWGWVYGGPSFLTLIITEDYSFITTESGLYLDQE
jgi:hypothetical protein